MRVDEPAPGKQLADAVVQSCQRTTDYLTLCGLLGEALRVYWGRMLELTDEDW